MSAMLKGSAISPADSNPGQSGLPNKDPNQNAWEQEQAFQNPSTQPTEKNTGELVRTTQYGWPTDNPSDKLTTISKVGNHDNPLTEHSIALSDQMAQSINAKPGDVIKIGDTLGYYADRAPENDKRVDIYQPKGMNKNIPDFQAIKNLGGGSQDLKGTALASTGETNIQNILSGITNPNPGPTIQQAQSDSMDDQIPAPVAINRIKRNVPNNVEIYQPTFANNSARASNNGSGVLRNLRIGRSLAKS